MVICRKRRGDLDHGTRANCSAGRRHARTISAARNVLTNERHVWNAAASVAGTRGMIFTADRTSDVKWLSDT